jgi:hypothetical protein
MTTAPSVARQLPLVIVVVFSVVLLSESASAQTEPPVNCVHSSPDWPWQTIEVHLVGEDCQINPYAGSTGIHRLRTWLGGKAFWDVCNRCGAPVDVRISGSIPNDLSDLFVGFQPMIDASEASTARNIPVGQRLVFSGDATGDKEHVGLNKYSIAVKFTSEGVGGWAEFDPELQMDDTGLPPPFLLGLPPAVLWLILALATLLGFAAGWWFARRRVTP